MRQHGSRDQVKRFVLLSLAVFASACSSAPKKTTPELSKLEGKRVALVDVEGEQTARTVVEVALVNQLLKRGTFILVSKKEVEAAKAAPEQNPYDWQGIAKRAGADFALKVKVLQFDADMREGYSSEEIEDSQLAAERGKDAARTKRLFKVKSLTGKVSSQLEFIQITAAGEKEAEPNRIGIAEAEETVTVENRDRVGHLPPKLRFLEKIANRAFQTFFEKYN